MTTLVTFIGRSEANRAYRITRYRFDDGVESESKLYAAAAIDWLRRGKRSPDRVLVIGTPTSGWDVLLELVERLAPQHANDALEWAIPVSESLARGPVEPSDLRAFESRFASALGFRIDLVLAENDGDSVFGALDAALANSERVVLDITHSFRSMPVHALISLGALRWLKLVEISDIIYGSLDERGPDGTSVARSLGSTAQLAAATPALAQLVLEDDVGGVGPYLSQGTPTLATALADTQRLESIMQFDAARHRRGQALGELRTMEASAMRHAVAGRTAETLSSLNAGRGSAGLKARAERALERNDFMRAIGLANEALALKAVEIHGLRAVAEQKLRDDRLPQGDLYGVITKLAREKLRENALQPDAPRFGRQRPDQTLKTLASARNAVMHAGTGLADQQAPHELLSPEQLRAVLKWSLAFYDFLH